MAIGMKNNTTVTNTGQGEAGILLRGFFPDIQLGDTAVISEESVDDVEADTSSSSRINCLLSSPLLLFSVIITA